MSNVAQREREIERERERRELRKFSDWKVSSWQPPVPVDAQ
jgi:hypothetical protein